MNDTKLGKLKKNMKHPSVKPFKKRVINIAASGSTNKIPPSINIQYLCALYGRHNKQRLFPYTALATVYIVKQNHSNA
jgi:hypothetical protein